MTEPVFRDDAAKHDPAGPRHHYLPVEVWVGFTVGEWPFGEWPLVGFTNQDIATRWAAERNSDGRTRFIFKLPVPADVELLVADVIPATYAVRRVDR